MESICENCNNKRCLKTGKPCLDVEMILHKQGCYDILPYITTIDPMVAQSMNSECSLNLSGKVTDKQRKRRKALDISNNDKSINVRNRLILWLYGNGLKYKEIESMVNGVTRNIISHIVSEVA